MNSSIVKYSYLLMNKKSKEAQELFNQNKKDSSFVRRANVVQKLSCAKSVPLGSRKAYR